MGQKRAEKLRRRKARQLKGTRRRDEPRQEWAVSPQNIALIDKGIQSVLTEPLVPLETVLDECNDSEREHAEIIADLKTIQASTAPEPAAVKAAPRRLQGKALCLSYSTLALLAGMSDSMVKQ